MSEYEKKEFEAWKEREIKLSGRIPFMPVGRCGKNACANHCKEVYRCGALDVSDR